LLVFPSHVHKCAINSFPNPNPVYSHIKQTLWLEFAGANYTDRETAALSAKLVPILADRGCRLVSPTNLSQSLIWVF
jgi:hypothetical protein